MSNIKFGNMECSMHVCEDAADIAEWAALSYDMGSKVWLNLTNGIEAAPYLDNLHVPYCFCRFRSCSFEQKRWGDAIDSMPDDMLMRLALGQRQVIIDFGANKPCPRAMRQGIPIAMRRIAASWGMDVDKHLYMFSRNGKTMQCDEDFTRHVMRIDEKQKHRLDYFGKYVDGDSYEHKIDLLCAPTVHDGDYDLHIEQALKMKL